MILLSAGCIVKGPKYTRIEKVMKLENGMSLNEVNKTLEIRPYDLIKIDSAGNRTLMYKYRLTDRRTVPLFLKDTNGKEIRAKFSDLYCTFDKNEILVKMYTQKSESELKEHRLNINSLLTFMTVTAPAVLIYLGINAQ